MIERTARLSVDSVDSRSGVGCTVASGLGVATCILGVKQQVYWVLNVINSEIIGEEVSQSIVSGDSCEDCAGGLTQSRGDTRLLTKDR